MSLLPRYKLPELLILPITSNLSLGSRIPTPIYPETCALFNISLGPNIDSSL